MPTLTRCRQQEWDPLREPTVGLPRCTYCGEVAIWVESTQVDPDSDPAAIWYCPADLSRASEPRFPGVPGTPTAAALADALLGDAE